MQNLIEKEKESEGPREDSSWELVLFFALKIAILPFFYIFETPLFLERGFNYTLIPYGAFVLNLMFNDYNSAGYLNSLVLLTDWVGCVSCAFVIIFNKTSEKSKNSY